MKIGYMTNAFGPLVGAGGGVTSVKDIRYVTMTDDEATLEQITKIGFKSIEVLEGNLTNYADDPQVLIDSQIRCGYDECLCRSKFHLSGRIGRRNGSLKSSC